MSSAIEEARLAGLDLSLIEASLSYSYEKRVMQHQAALDLMLEIEKARRQLRDSIQAIASAPPGR